MNLLRTSPEKFVRLYKKWGLKPQSGSHRVVSGRTCAVGIAIVELMGCVSTSFGDVNQAFHEICRGNPKTIRDFMVGFDAGTQLSRNTVGSRAFKHGYEVGVEAAQYLRRSGRRATGRSV